jgi:nucleoside-diphosphate-sugar epimerase
MADRLAAGMGVVVGRGDNALPFVYVTDVVQGLLLALDCEHAAGQAYNITNDQPLTQQEFLEAIAHDIGVDPPSVHVPYRALYAVGAAAERAAALTGSRRQPIVTRLGVKLFGTDNRHAIDRARRELGYTPQVTIREGVRRAAEWYRTQSQPDSYSNYFNAFAQSPCVKNPQPSTSAARIYVPAGTELTVGPKARPLRLRPEAYRLIRDFS